MSAVTLAGVLTGLSPDQIARLAARQTPAVRARIEALTKTRAAAAPSAPRASEVQALVARLGPNVCVSLKGLRLVSEANAHELPFVRARRAKAERAAFAEAVAAAGFAAPEGVTRVRITREGPRLLDTDNVQGSAKHVRDAVAEWLHVDDGPNGPVTWEVVQRQGKGYAVDVEIFGGAR